MDSYRIIISTPAQEDIASCVSFVLKVSKEAATCLKNEILSSIDSLSFFPERNPLFNMPINFSYPIRKLIINKRYVALYSIESENVVVYRVIDSRKQFNSLVE